MKGYVIASKPYAEKFHYVKLIDQQGCLACQQTGDPDFTVFFEQADAEAYAAKLAERIGSDVNRVWEIEIGEPKPCKA